MKKSFSVAAVAVVMFAMLVNLSSCEKDEGKLPNIAFKTGTGYTSADVSLPATTALTVGINASKAEDKDVLKTFDVSVSVDGATPTSINGYPISLTSAQEDTYSVDLPFAAPPAGSNAKYSFTVTNRDGLVNTISLTVTGQ
jgi:hypothetical protein